jgi:hypothetical protein
MEGTMQISLGDRVRVAGRAIRGLFKSPTPQETSSAFMPGCFPAVRGAEFPGYGDTARSLKDPKSKKSGRSVPAPRELVHDLRLWKLKCPPTPQDAACVKAEVPRRTLHRLRHTFASLLIMRGRPLPEVIVLLGHRDIGITAKVYAHFIDQKTTAAQDLGSSVLGHAKK